MEVAGTGDLRAHVDLPLALRVLGKPQRPGAARRGREAARLAARRRPAQDADRDGVYEHADAIRIMDAWWPLWVKAQFKPALGTRAFDALTDDRRDRQPAQQPRRAPRLGLPGLLVRLREQGPAHDARRRVRGPYSRALLRRAARRAAPRCGARWRPR